MGERIVGGSKWGESFDGGTPVERVFRQVWQQRSEPVRGLVREILATEQPRVERFHQLRVASRRLQAAMEAFDDQMPRKLRERLNEKLDELRGLAGKTRDLDVFAVFFEEQASAPEAGLDPEIWERLREVLTDERNRELAKLQKELPALLAELDPLLSETDVRLKKKGTKKSQTMRIDRYASERLPEMSRAFWKRLKGADEETKELHRLRIQGKEYRYVLELFAPLFAEEFREELYPELEKLQEGLGSLQDRITARKLILRLKRKTKVKHWESRGLKDELKRGWVKLLEANRSRRRGLREPLRALIHQMRSSKLEERFGELVRGLEIGENRPTIGHATPVDAVVAPEKKSSGSAEAEQE